jgi:RHS repeat-associated protein
MRIFTQYTTERGTDVLQDFLYTFDPMGNITWMKDEATQTIYFSNNIITPDKNYTYDAIYRLIEAQGREHIGQVAEYEELPFMNIPHPNDPQAMRRYSRSFSYDNSGNITQMAHTATGGNWTRDYSYTSGKNRLASTIIGGATVNYTHDNNGNIESLPNTGAVTWDSEDRIKEVNLGGGGTAYYTYNAQGERIRKVIHNNSGIKIKETLYLDGYEVYHEFVTGTVDFERETLHVIPPFTTHDSPFTATGKVAMVETKTIENSTPISSPVPRIRYQHSDHLGSSSVETSDTGALISFEEYYPYGGTSFQSTSSSSQVSAKRYRYNGKEKDEETNLYYYGARYYISWLGRWMNCDPLGEEGSGLNLYRYASNNPVTRIDPTGMADIPVNEKHFKIENNKKEKVKSDSKNTDATGKMVEKFKSLVEKSQTLQKTINSVDKLGVKSSFVDDHRAGYKPTTNEMFFPQSEYDSNYIATMQQNPQLLWTLGHELTHVKQFFDAFKDYLKREDKNFASYSEDTMASMFKELDEKGRDKFFSSFISSFDNKEAFIQKMLEWEKEAYKTAEKIELEIAGSTEDMNKWNPVKEKAYTEKYGEMYDLYKNQKNEMKK